MSESFSLPVFAMTDYDFYRLDDRVFFAFIAAALIFCVVHAARRAFRQPRPSELPPDTFQSAKGEEIERHTIFQRVYHWFNAAAVITLVISGWMIYQPKLIPILEGKTFDWFFWHRWGVALLLIGLAFHFTYESFIARGSNPMAVNCQEVQKFLAVLKNFFAFSQSYPLATKYHPGQIFFHWAVSGNLFLLILTGFVIWKPFRDFLPLSLFGLGWDFIFYNRLLHGFFSATLIANLIGHIYFALFIKKNWAETKSMLTGRISLPAYLESHSRLD
jgi:formate dehydrogenase-N gamma subunit